jgi:uncharacterized membrane protein YgdD (TMEM256/DUF423 family)
VALIALSMMTPHSEKGIIRICRMMTIGVIIFSGSIYLLAFKLILGLPWLKYLGPITPIGGICMIASWFMLFNLTLQKKAS